MPFGAFPREVFACIGEFDVELVRNQDDELNFRLLQAGGTVWFDPAISTDYFSCPTLRRFWRQYFQYGVYKIRVAQKRDGFASARHVVPAAFVVATAASLLARGGPPRAALGTRRTRAVRPRERRGQRRGGPDGRRPIPSGSPPLTPCCTRVMAPASSRACGAGDGASCRRGSVADSGSGALHRLPRATSRRCVPAQ